MKLTVAICTWNRANLLDKTLDAMGGLQVPRNTEWEVLVVNNNCTDDTDKVVSNHAGRLPVRQVHEPAPGLSCARNTAVQAALGDYILWTDDDVLVDSGWLCGYREAIERWPDAAVFGGPITPWFEGTPPRWLRTFWPMVSSAYAICDLGSEPVPLTEKSLPFGANYAVRLSTHRRYLYDPSLGRKGPGMVGYEESTLIRTMLKDGLRGLWVPDAKVRHFIPAERQTVGYLKRYFEGQGFYVAGRDAKTGARAILGCPPWLLRQAIERTLKYYVNRTTRSPDVWIEDLVQCSMLRGMVHGFRERARHDFSRG